MDKKRKAGDVSSGFLIRIYESFLIYSPIFPFFN
jgi:hypothetical protein